MFKRITVLRYHTVEPEGSARLREEEKFYNVTPEKFREQVYYLKKSGYSAVSLKELISIEQNDKLPRKPIMLTFDDGHISHYETVLPILKECGFKGVFFLVVNEIGKEHRLNWEQAKALKNSGMEIGSHSLNHAIINKYSYPNLILELKASKLELEENLGTEILAFSIPRGMYSPKISNVARGMGYKLVFTSFAGNISLYSNPYCLRRMGMRSGYSMKEFISIVRKDPIFIMKKHFEQFAKSRVKRAIGVKAYDRLKDSIFQKGIASSLRSSQ